MGQHKDHVIIQQVKEGNVAAFELLYEMYFNRMASYAQRFVKDNEIAREIGQEVFLKIWEKRSLLAIEYPFVQIGLSMTRNLCIDYLRKQAHKKKYEEHGIRLDRELALGALNDPISEKLILKDIEELVRQSFLDLPDINKLIYQLNRDQGMTYAEIADKLNVSVKTIEYRMMQTLRVLRLKLKDFLVLCFLFDIFS